MAQDFTTNNQSPLQHTMSRQREILKYITNISSSLRLKMDSNELLKQVAIATCEALCFRHTALYLLDAQGVFRVQSTYGISVEEEIYLHEHPLSNAIVAQLINEEYRMSDSYFIPSEAPLWLNEVFADYFLVVGDEQSPSFSSPSSLDLANRLWRPTDMIVVPLISGDNTLLGFFTPDDPLDGLRPDAETMSCLELFANQAAMIIEAAHLYKAAKQSSEERAALVEIGRALFAPEALHDLHSVYQTIYKQVERVMPTDAFIVSRYQRASGRLVVDYIVDEGIVYPPEDFTWLPLWVRKLLTKEVNALLFSTQEEYSLASYTTDADRAADLVGNMCPSESLIFVPIHYGEECIGILSVQSYQPHTYTQGHVEMLREIAVQAGIAITNARLYTELREAVKLAQESEQLKNHFLLAASHELRTPLTAIQGYLELLSVHGSVLSNSDRDRFIANARRASEELILLLGNVMDTTHIDEVNLNMGPVQIGQSIRPILNIVEPTVVRQERKVEVAVAENLFVWADELRLRQILLNVVGNALKYTPIATTIAISATSTDWNSLRQRIAPGYQTELPSYVEGHFVVLTIRDWGAGIPPQDQQRLFTKFIRLSNDVTSAQRGSGLGLYLCRQLTEAMGGYIWLESTGIAGEGTSFLIALPQYNS